MPLQPYSRSPRCLLSYLPALAGLLCLLVPTVGAAPLGEPAGWAPATTGASPLSLTRRPAPLPLSAPAPRPLRPVFGGGPRDLVPYAAREPLAFAVRLPRLVYPLDLGRQGRFDPDFAPFYLPETYPGAIAETMVGEAYLESPLLGQGSEGTDNPFAIMREQALKLHADPDLLLERALEVGAYAWLMRDYGLTPEDYVRAFFNRSSVVNQEMVAQVAIPLALKVLPPLLTQVDSGPGQIPVDLAVHTPTSFDSVAAPEVMLTTAARRGLQAVVVADRGRIDGAQETQRLAERLQAEGRLPANFQVLVGETIATSSGTVVGIFLKERIPERMTIGYTVREIHRQGGLAYMAHPGLLGGPRMLRDLPFDGYFIRHGFREMFRTMRLLYDPRLGDKVALYASNSLYASGAGLPYSAMEAESSDPQALYQALATGQAYAASGLYLPWMAAITVRPVGGLLRLVNGLSVWREGAELWLTRLLRSDNVRLYINWDRELQRWMDLWDLPSGVWDVLRGHSPLSGGPEVLEMSADYGPVQVRYDLEQKRLSLEAVLTW